MVIGQVPILEVGDLAMFGWCCKFGCPSYSLCVSRYYRREFPQGRLFWWRYWQRQSRLRGTWLCKFRLGWWLVDCFGNNGSEDISFLWTWWQWRFGCESCLYCIEVRLPVAYGSSRVWLLLIALVANSARELRLLGSHNGKRWGKGDVHIFRCLALCRVF